jgi:hypothetical protein
MRFVGLTDAIFSNLRNIAALPVAANSSPNEREMHQMVVNTVQQVVSLPELADPTEQAREIETLHEDNQRLRTDNARLQATIDRLLAQPVNDQPARAPRNEKIPDIPMFDGTRNKLQPWIDQLWLKISDEGRYTTLQSKLVYAFSRCEGTALDHLRPHRNAGTLDFASVQALIDVLEAAFEDPDRRGTARRTLHMLRQENDDFPSFFAKFQAQVPHAGMDDGGLLAAMIEAVNPRIRDRMIGMHPAPETLNDFVAVARRIDAGFRAEKERKAGTTHATSGTPARTPRTTPRTPTTATGTEPGPMDLSRSRGAGGYPKLSQQERERRLRQGLCFRCGGQGHLSTACPSRANRTTTIAAITTPDPQEESSSAAATTEQSEN